MKTPGKKFTTTEVSTFAGEMISDLEQAALACGNLDPLTQPTAYRKEYARLSRERRLLYTYISELEAVAAEHSSTVAAHRRTTTHLRF